MSFKTINKKNIQGKTETFFRSSKWKNTLLFLSFVALASGFWALQYFHDKFDFEIPVKVQYENVPVGIVLSGNAPQEITLYVQDKGSAYLNYLFRQKRQLLSIAIDLEAISPNKTSYTVDQTALRNLAGEKLLSTTQLKFVSPDKIDVDYSQLAQKELPVTVNGIVSPASGYLISDSVVIEPANVVVYGDKDNLDTLREIQTLPVEYTAIDKDWSVFADLKAPKGIYLPVKKVKLSAKIEEYTEKSFEMPIVCDNLPPNLKVHFFPSAVELGVKVGLSKYSQLSKSDFEIAVNYNDLKDKTSTNCLLTLKRKPAWLKNYRIAPEVVEFLIEQNKNL